MFTLQTHLVRAAGVACALFIPAVACAQPAGTQPAPSQQGGAPASDAPGVVPQMLREAAALAPLLESDLSRAFLSRVSSLPEPTARTIWRSREKGTAHSQAQYEALPEAEQAGLVSREFPPGFTYTTAYGSPLVYARVLDLAARYGLASLADTKVLDFGYGSIGQLRLMALMGAEARGVDVEPALAALYAEPGDTGALGDGEVHVHHGRWPADDAMRQAIGAGYDLITSKNTLKAGYIHPAREVDPRMLVDLGVDDAAFLAAVHDALVPGGLFIIYNICPAQNPPEAAPEKPYISWADGWSPFTREQFEAAGLETLEFDARDDEATRRIFLALGYDNGKGMEGLEREVFTWYTVARRRR